MDAVKQAIEPEFLSRALATGVRLRIGQMNKSEHEGVVREAGKYEINVEEQGSIITLLKQDISFLSAPSPLVAPPAPAEVPAAATGTRPNIQQEFLEKAIRERHHLTLFLVTGQRVKATIEAFDNFTLLVRDGERQNLVYKHAITTINR